jgi:hypothetical protein
MAFTFTLTQERVGIKREALYLLGQTGYNNSRVNCPLKGAKGPLELESAPLYIYIIYTVYINTSVAVIQGTGRPLGTEVPWEWN